MLWDEGELEIDAWLTLELVKRQRSVKIVRWRSEIDAWLTLELVKRQGSVEKSGAGQKLTFG